MKFYVRERSVRYKGKTYIKGACIEANTEEEKEILKDLVKQGYASENVVNIGEATEIISREREDLNEKREELKKLETSLKLKENKLSEREEKLNKLEITLSNREKELYNKEHKPGVMCNDEEVKDALNTALKNNEIYEKLTKKEKTKYEGLSEEEKETVNMFETYEDVKAYLSSIEGN